MSWAVLKEELENNRINTIFFGLEKGLMSYIEMEIFGVS